MEWTFIIIGSALVIYFIVLIPIQYSYITAMKKRRKEANLSQNQLYDNMTFEEQQLHYNLQGNLINLPSTLAAMLIYKIRYR